MKIAGLVKSSLIDYPGKIAAVVFTQGCNFRCGFCHNPDLIPTNNPTLLIDEKEVIDFLNLRKAVLDGVVITGGEPSLQPDLISFIEKINELDLKVKLDTNGANPEMIEKLIEKKLISYIAMDIKGSVEQYDKICGYKNIEVIKRSIKQILNSGISHEFRTTVLPFYHNLEDFHKIGKSIAGADKYTIQGFRPEITFNKDLGSQKPFSREELEKIKNIMTEYVKEVLIHENL